MKKSLSIILVLVLTLALFAGCSKGGSEASPTPAVSPNTSTDVPETLSGTVATNGSTSMEKTIAALSEAFMAKHTNVIVTFDATGSGAGITAAREGTADIGLSSRNLKTEETGLEATVIAIDGIAIIVNSGNPVADLSLDQITKLAKGEITSWGEVGGDEAPVVFIGREAGSGTRDGFESIVGAEDECVYEQELTSTGAVVAAVAANPNAIGYASLSGIGDTVKAVNVDGIVCAEDTLLDGTYPVQRNFNMITKQGAELSAAAKAFIEFALSPEAADIIAAAGAVQAK